MIVGQTLVVDGGTTSWLPFGDGFRHPMGGQFGRLAKVPEPGSFLLLALGGLGLLCCFRRRATKAARAEA